MLQRNRIQTSLSTQTETTPPILRLRRPETRQKEDSKVKWTEDVIDNEHMGKHKLKVCCIFHPHREFGQSSDESSDSSSDSSDDSDYERNNDFDQNHRHSHNFDDINSDNSHSHSHGHNFDDKDDISNSSNNQDKGNTGMSKPSSSSPDNLVCEYGHIHKRNKKVRKPKRSSSPNAYERQPNYRNKLVVPVQK